MGQPVTVGAADAALLSCTHDPSHGWRPSVVVRWFIWLCYCACASCVAIPASPMFRAGWRVRAKLLA